LTEDKIREVEAVEREIAEGLNGATFTDKWHYFDLLDGRATFALEDGLTVVYVKCRQGKQRLPVGKYRLYKVITIYRPI
jgi:hypothetical protein